MKRLLLLLAVCLSGISMVCSQNQTIQGTVVNASDGEPIIGASVAVQGTSQGSITSVDGEFQVSVAQGAKLVISFIGMKSQVVEAHNGIVVRLEEDASQLDEVMVVAFGTSTKKSFTGSASVVKSDEISKRQTSNVTGALAGQVAGVQGFSSNGQPGEVTKIRIRGVGSMYADNEPLYVVDGVPADNDMISALSNNDIESITVLKDAASNALYGARGANGVVLITTKRGSSRDAQITVDAKWGSNSRAVPTYSVMTDPGMYYEKYYEALYMSQYAAGASSIAAHNYANKYLLDADNGGLGYLVYTVPDGERLIGTNGELNPNAVLGYSDGSNTYLPDNWYNELFNKGNFRQEYNVNLSGSTDKLTYYASASYLDDTGLIENSDYSRISTRISVDYQAKPWLKIGTNMAYAHIDQNYPEEQTTWGSSGNLFYVSNHVAPIYPLYVRDANGNIMTDANGFTIYDYGDGKSVASGVQRPFMTQSSPASSVALDQAKYKNDMFSGKWYAQAELYHGLKLNASVGAAYFGSRYQYTLNPWYGQYADKGGAAGVSQSRTMTVNQLYTLTYNNRFGGLHNVDALVGYENYQYTYSLISGEKSKLFNGNIAEINNAILTPTASSYTHRYVTMGILAQAKYDYASKYYLSASYRRDASSRFAKKNRWGNFWSVGLAWDMNAEDWMAPAQDVVSLFKWKVSYGAQGNDNLLTPSGATNYYLYADQYTLSESNGDFAAVLAYKGNEDITWETSYNFNAGIDFSLFNERLGGTVEGFRRRTVDMLYYKPVPTSMGYSNYPVNIGSVSNAGLDIELHGDVISTNRVTWTLYANLTYFKNKILQLSPELNGEWVSSNYLYREGESLYNLYLREYAGVDPTTGESLWYKDEIDDSGNPTGNKITTNDWTDATRYATGDILPKVYGGFGTTLNAYGIDVSLSFAYQLGGRVLDYTYQDLMHSAYNHAGENWHTDILRSWTPDNTDTDVPRVSTSDQYTNALSTRWLTSSDYLCLQNITIGYTLPSKWMRKIHLQSLRLYAVADNVALWSARRGLDPRQGFATSDSGSSYSPIRSISGGLTLTF